MSSFLTNIVSRHLGKSPTVSTRKRSIFETDRYVDSFENEEIRKDEDGTVTQQDQDSLLPKAPPEAPILPDVSEKSVKSNNSDLPKEPHHVLNTADTKDNISNFSKSIYPEPPKSSPPSTPTDKSPIKISDSLKNSSLPKATSSSIPEDESFQPADKTTGRTPFAGLPQAKAGRIIDQKSTEIYNKPSNQVNFSTLSQKSQGSDAPDEPPTIKINIGKIEVKAPPAKKASTQRNRKKAASEPQLSLAQFLKNRTP